jgi:hypothetical protein
MLDIPLRRLPVAVLLTLWTLGSASGQELDRARFGVGFVANAPSQMAGVGGYVLLPVLGGVGVYVDGKWDIDSPAGDRAFDESRTAADLEADASSAGTRFLRRETSWYRSLNLALVRPLNPFLMAYVGGGYARAKRYGLYEELVGDVGRALWVRDPRQDEDRMNLMAGLILRLVPMFSTQVGLETQPRGFTAGVSLRLPPW